MEELDLADEQVAVAYLKEIIHDPNGSLENLMRGLAQIMQARGTSHADEELHQALEIDELPEE